MNLIKMNKTLNNKSANTECPKTDKEISIISFIKESNEINQKKEFRNKVKRVIKSMENCIIAIKNENDDLHDFLLDDLRKNSYLDVKSVSIYISDSNDRIFLHRNRCSDKYIPNEAYITPIIGLCNNNTHIETALKLIEDFLGINVKKDKLTPIWGDDNNMHISYYYHISDTFENIEKDFIESKVGGNFEKYKKYEFESNIHRCVYYCKFTDVTYLDNRFDYNKKENKWIWTLHRRNGCTAVYNVFQWIVKRKNDNIINQKYSERLYVKKRIDISISSIQSIIWSILKKGYFENRFFHLGKIGCHLEYCIEHNLHKYIPINSIPMYETEHKELKNNYINHNDYDKCNEDNFVNSLKSSRRNMVNRYLKNNLQIIVV